MRRPPDAKGAIYTGTPHRPFLAKVPRARLMFVGEQPGDEEDRSGHPFVGPSGRLLRKAMQDAGIALRDAYITNAVKHFKFIERGKRRIHAKPKVTASIARN